MVLIPIHALLRNDRSRGGLRIQPLVVLRSYNNDIRTQNSSMGGLPARSSFLFPTQLPGRGGRHASFVILSRRKLVRVVGYTVLPSPTKRKPAAVGCDVMRGGAVSPLAQVPLFLGAHAHELDSMVRHQKHTGSEDAVDQRNTLSPARVCMYDRGRPVRCPGHHNLDDLRAGALPVQFVVGIIPRPSEMNFCSRQRRARTLPSTPQGNYRRP